MELKQMEYLIAAVECKSLNKAAERLFTSQSNVSKVLIRLEDDLNAKILERTSKGVYLTVLGEQVYKQALKVVKTFQNIEKIADTRSNERLRVASYQSFIVSQKLSKFYNANCDEQIHIEFMSGAIMEVIEHIFAYNADIGILFYPCLLEQAFTQMIKRKHLEYFEFSQCNICVYLGPEHPYYKRDSLCFEDLQDLKFVQGRRDYYSVMEQIYILSDGKVELNKLNHVVHTNSEHVIMNSLQNTNLCNININRTTLKFKEGMIKTLPISDCDNKVSIGYIKRSNHEINAQELDFIESVRELF